MKKQSRIASKWGYQLSPSRIEKRNTEPSMTVPDQAFTIQDILLKYTRGINLGLVHNGEYLDGDHDDPDMEQLARADLYDRAEFHSQPFKEDLKSQLDAVSKAQKAAAERAAASATAEKSDSKTAKSSNDDVNEA